jgi:hypothetical protein
VNWYSRRPRNFPRYLDAEALVAMATGAARAATALAQKTIGVEKNKDRLSTCRRKTN